nr:PREDICTED: zinc finger protein 580 [Equus przewalskii]
MSETPRQLGRPPSQRRSSPSRPAQRPAAGGVQRAPPAHGHARRACKFPARPEDVLWAPRVRLRGQRQRHSGWLSTLQPFGCPECARVFASPLRLQSHRVSHSDLKPFTCGACGKAFKRSSHLSRHRATHRARAGPPHTCPLCPRRFQDAAELAQHVRLH